MQKSKTFRYGYDVGDFLSSAFSGWLFWVAARARSPSVS